MITKTASVSGLRDNISDYIKDLPEDETILVLRHNTPVAYLMSPEHYIHIHERLEAIEDIRDMLEVIKDFKNGGEDLIDAEDFFKEIGI